MPTQIQIPLTQRRAIPPVSPQRAGQTLGSPLQRHSYQTSPARFTRFTGEAAIPRNFSEFHESFQRLAEDCFTEMAKAHDPQAFHDVLMDFRTRLLPLNTVFATPWFKAIEKEVDPHLHHEFLNPLNHTINVTSQNLRGAMRSGQWDDAFLLALQQEFKRYVQVAIAVLNAYRLLYDPGANVTKASVWSLAQKSCMADVYATNVKYTLKGKKALALLEKTPLTPQALYHVLRNVFMNAAKYTERGGIQVLFVPSFGTDSTGQYREYLKFQVADTGMGIPKGQGRRVFSGRRGSNAEASEFSGTAMGLGYVRETLQQEGGSVFIESPRHFAFGQSRKGTAVVTYIPLNTGEDVVHHVPSSPTMTSSPAHVFEQRGMQHFVSLTRLWIQSVFTRPPSFATA